MAGFGLVVLIEVLTKLERGLTPDAPIMLGVALVALAANAAALSFLWRHRADDINMSSAWLCSRNDVLANGASCSRRRVSASAVPHGPMSSSAWGSRLCSASRRSA